jgi:hypothetical protein
VKSINTVSIFIAAMLVCLVIAVWLFRRVLQLRHGQPASVFAGAEKRPLNEQERAAIEGYLDSLTDSGISPAGAATLTLNASSNTVLSFTRSITRYGLSTDDPNKWRYYLDSVEVHLPPFWEQYITNDNNIELIRTETLPLIIALNGHTLQEYRSEAKKFTLERSEGLQASIRGKESEQIELLNIRQETHEEHALSRPDGLREAFLIVGAFLLSFLCVISPGVMVPWLLGGAIMLLAAAMWGLFAPPAKNTLREIHCLRGTPRRWGLFGESNQEQNNNISLGIIDLIYPPHWQPFIAHDLGNKTDIDIYLDRQVVRQGRFLSLHDEVTNFPLQQWMRNLTIAIGALLTLLMLMLWAPLEMPLKMTLSWLKGAQTIETVCVEALEKINVRVGDTLRVSGTGMCNIQLPNTYTPRQNSPFTPFDCSQIVWNSAQTAPLPESDIVEKAIALSDTVNKQLHPDPGNDDNSKVSPQLALAIQKSGMVLLYDFSDIVLKTQALCISPDECVRLKNALVNLGNSKSWDALLRRARNGKLNGLNVILRPVSAESLENLVATSTAPFFIRETARAAQALNSPAPGGFVIISDEGADLVDQALPPMSLYDYPPREQWHEFQRLATMLTNTPFSAEGIITSIQTDANGTRHVTLHSIPDSVGQWRFVGTTLLFFVLVSSFIVNGILAVRRYQRYRHRLTSIHQYYESCFNPRLLPQTDDDPLY